MTGLDRKQVHRLMQEMAADGVVGMATLLDNYFKGDLKA